MEGETRTVAGGEIVQTKIHHRRKAGTDDVHDHGVGPPMSNMSSSLADETRDGRPELSVGTIAWISEMVLFRSRPGWTRFKRIATPLTLRSKVFRRHLMVSVRRDYRNSFRRRCKGMVGCCGGSSKRMAGQFPRGLQIVSRSSKGAGSVKGIDASRGSTKWKLGRTEGCRNL